METLPSICIFYQLAQMTSDSNYVTSYVIELVVSKEMTLTDVKYVIFKPNFFKNHSKFRIPVGDFFGSVCIPFPKIYSLLSVAPLTNDTNSL